MNSSKNQLSRRNFCKIGTGALGSFFLADSVRGNGIFSSSPSDTFADTILFNGNIVTMNSTNTIAQAVAIKDGLIYQVGTTDAIRALAGPNTKTVNLVNRIVTPGLIDSHNHLQVWGLLKNFYVALMPPEVTTMDDLRDKLAEAVGQAPEGEWIQGYFLVVGDRLPNRQDIDPVSPNHPVWLIQQGGHYGSANSLALQIAGITSETPDPTGGVIERDANGDPTGVFYNHRAMDVMRVHVPLPTDEMVHSNIVDGQHIFAAGGVTTFHDNNIRGVDTIGSYFDTDRDGNMLIRGRVYYTLEWPGDLDRALNAVEYYEGNGFMHFAGFKFLLDGQLRMAYCHEPHNGERWDTPTWDPQTFKDTVKALHDTGKQICVHCAGDATVDLALDAFEEAMNANPLPDTRHRIEHCILTTPQATQRIKDLGVVVSTQPQFIRGAGDHYKPIFGEERGKRAIVTREWLDAGIPLALGSDAPTTPWVTPLITLFGAVTRITYSDQSYEPEQCLTAQEAFYAHTMGSAYAGFEENIKGSIEPGKLADLILWNQDPFTTLDALSQEPLNPEIYLPALQSLQIDMTMVGGQAVYVRNNTGVDKQKKTLPVQIRLQQNYPNPFNAKTTICFEIPSPLRVQINILDVSGRLVAKVVDKHFSSGQHKIAYDSSQLPSGSYLIQLKTRRFTDIKKMIVLK